MTRRGAGPLGLRGGERGSGAFGFGGNLPIVGFGLVALLLLVLVIIFLASRCGGASAHQVADCTGKAPAPPQGYAYASGYCVMGSSYGQYAGQNVSLQIKLSDRSTTRGLSIYSYDGGKWTRLAPAEVIAGGTQAQNTTAMHLPKSFAVLRRTGGDFLVLGELPQNTFASPDAAQFIADAAPFTYTPAADGSLNGGPVNVPQGAPYGVMPAITAQSGAASQNVNGILAGAGLRSTHIDRIVAEAARGNYEGIELDYSAVDTPLKDNFTQFVQALADKLHAANRKLVLRLPLPRKDANGWNTGAYDWAALGRSADLLIMAVERDQSIYRTRVPDAVKYLTGLVDSHRLLLEVSPLSEERADSGSVRALTTLEALSLAGQITVRDPDKLVTGGQATLAAENINREGGSGPNWTPQGVVSFEYKTQDGQRTVWIENSFSVGYKLEIVQVYHLGGVAVDDASANPAVTNIWPAVQQYQAAGAPLLQQPNPQTLRPSWLADGKPIADAGNRAVITWTAPDTPGSHTISVIVSDGTMRVIDTTSVTVRAGTPAGPGASPAASPSGRFTPTPARATPTRSSR
ncbi:MAG TPA: hypothetical protein VKV26_14980 [Dehalococcoidia bacterium]|nr:hypothetical protein [Dehalococcoidia bacterium]